MFYSIITVNFNSAKTLRRTIYSVLQQQFVEFEYLVVDGASTDDSLDILNGIDDPRFQFISEPDAGLYDAMNKGIDLARGEWILILNADDYFLSDCGLRDLIPYLNPGKLNFCQIRHDSGRIQKYTKGKDLLYLSAFIPHPGLIISRRQYERFGKFNTELLICADHDLILRCSKALPLNPISLTLVHMSSGGLSEVRWKEACDEFRSVLLLNGTSSLVSWVIHIVRISYMRVRMYVR